MRAVRLAGLGWSAPALLLLSCTPESPDPVRIEAQSFANSGWTAPISLGAPVNSPTANDQGAALSPDGLALYFCSNRPGGTGGNDLWVSRRASEDEPWGDAVNLGPTVNSTSAECGPALSQDGLILFFTSGRPGGAGGNDLYMAARTDPSDDLSWAAPVALGPEVNTSVGEFSPFVTRWYDDGTAELYFDRATSSGTNDIFVATITMTGVAVAPAAPVAELNSADNDIMPTVRFDGHEVLLSSNRDGRGGDFDLFVSTRRSRNDPWSIPEPVAALSASLMHELHPDLSRDGRTIVFTRGTGTANDIWVSTRTPSGR